WAAYPTRPPPPVARRHAGPDPEPPFERLEPRLRVDEAAANVGADLDHVRPGGLELEQVVEGRDRHAVRGREVERLAALLERLAREPAAVALLRDAERGEHRRLRRRIFLRDLANLVD